MFPVRVSVRDRSVSRRTLFQSSTVVMRSLLLVVSWHAKLLMCLRVTRVVVEIWWWCNCESIIAKYFCCQFFWWIKILNNSQGTDIVIEKRRRTRGRFAMAVSNILILGRLMVGIRREETDEEWETSVKILKDVITGWIATNVGCRTGNDGKHTGTY